MSNNQEYRLDTWTADDFRRMMDLGIPPDVYAEYISRGGTEEDLYKSIENSEKKAAECDSGEEQEKEDHRSVTEKTETDSKEELIDDDANEPESEDDTTSEEELIDDGAYDEGEPENEEDDATTKEELIDDDAYEPESEDDDATSEEELTDGGKKKGDQEEMRAQSAKKSGRSSCRIERKCVICQVETKDMSKHLERQHNLHGEERWKYIYKAREQVPIQRKRTTATRKGASCSLCPAKKLTKLSDHMKRKHPQEYGVKGAKGKTVHVPDCDIYEKYRRYVKLCSADHCGSTTAKQHVSNLKRVQGIIGKGGIETLFHDQSAIMRVYEELRKQYAPKTVNNYLSSISKFVNMLKVEYEDMELLNINDRQVGRIEGLLLQMGRNLRPSIKQRQSELKDNIAETLVPVEDLRSFHLKLTNSADLVTRTLQEGGTVNFSDLEQYRNLVVLLTIINGAPRSDVLSNMTVGEVRKATEVDGMYVIKVTSHKTKGTYGCKNIILSKDEWRYFEGYSRDVRSQFCGKTGKEEDDDEDDPYFLQENGSSLSKPSPELQKSWKKLGFKGKISTRAIRKTVATTARDHLSDKEREQVATYMAHSLQTANTYYAARWKTSQNVKARAMVRSLLLGEGPEDQGEPTPTTLTQQASHSNKQQQQQVEATTANTAGQHSIKVQKTKRRTKQIFSTHDEEELQRTVRMCVGRICSRKKKARLREITDQAYDLVSADLQRRVDSKQFYDKARHLGLGKELW